ncbi:MAG TPA: GlsB/YeaQ/YmgE family stress response membrane protein [Gaiellaceae bacterium]|nr:GlsB/YeaQ/YmgE family stress response membrane protein [Gaiellaceae bacterium]
MGIIAWILLGLLAGMLAKFILPGDDPGGIIITTIIGIVGAILGGLVAKALGFGDPIDEFFDISTWVAAIVGALVLLVAYRAVAGRGGAVSRG